MENIKLAIASPSSSAYSETFILMQMERLPCALRIHGGPVASETLPGGPISPLKSWRGIIDTAMECGIRGRKWEGPQENELLRRMRRAEIQCILSNYGPQSLALIPLAKQLQIPLIVHFHGKDAHKKSVIESYRKDYLQLAQNAAAIIAVSQRMVESLLELGFPESKIHLVRCGANDAKFEEKSRFPLDPVFFGVGRFVDKKAPYLTVLAFKAVHDAIPSARLILGGTGDLLEATKNLAEALGLREAVTFPGILSPDCVASHMQDATAFVQHSITPRCGPSEGDSEGTPVAILEALTTGLPVISTRHAGIGEVVREGETGLLVDERDVDGMAQAMIRVARDPVFARQMGAKAREDALRHYTADQYINSLMNIIESITPQR